MITIKRVYDPASPHDGARVLVDRLWPRGMKKETAAIDLWAKAIAPTTELRQWYGHNPERWEEFQLRYRLELTQIDRKDELSKLRAIVKARAVTLLTATRNQSQSHAVVLQELLDR